MKEEKVERMREKEMEREEKTQARKSLAGAQRSALINSESTRRRARLRAPIADFDP